MINEQFPRTVSFDYEGVEEVIDVLSEREFSFDGEVFRLEEVDGGFELESKSGQSLGFFIVEDDVEGYGAFSDEDDEDEIVFSSETLPELVGTILAFLSRESEEDLESID